jgi:chromosome partitioning protein
MGKIIAIVNQMVGVGKTTTAVNLGASLARLGHKTLVVDTDPKANATSMFNFFHEPISHNIYECMLGQVSPKEAICPSKIVMLDLIPSHSDFASIEFDIINKRGREKIMRKLLNTIKDEYEYILLDCAPSLGIITVNNLTAASSVIIPFQCEYFMMEGLKRTMNTIKIVQNKLNPGLKMEGVLITKFDSQLNVSKQVVEEIRLHFQHDAFNTVIPKRHVENEVLVNYLKLAEEITGRN